MNDNILSNIVKQYDISGGSFDDELIEQEFCIKYINPNNNILELGSNIGRVSIVISHILKSGTGKQNQHLPLLQIRYLDLLIE